MKDTKICTKCKVEKSVSEFCKNKKTKDGLGVYCSECRRIINKGYQTKYRERKKQGYVHGDENKKKELVRDTSLFPWARNCDSCGQVEICRYRVNVGMWVLCERPDKNDIERMKDVELPLNKLYPKELLCQENLLMFA